MALVGFGLGWSASVYFALCTAGLLLYRPQSPVILDKPSWHMERLSHLSILPVDIDCRNVETARKTRREEIGYPVGPQPDDAGAVLHRAANQATSRVSSNFSHMGQTR